MFDLFNDLFCSDHALLANSFKGGLLLNLLDFKLKLNTKRSINGSSKS